MRSRAATGQTFPDNHILSHDLIEGNFARCGLVTDIELFDDFPARYHAYARREHRWIRGDWQLLPWLGPRVPVPPAPKPAGESSSLRGTPQARRLARGLGDGVGTRPNPLPLLERWKIFDNLRRSLVPPALVVWLALGWTVLPVPWWLTMGLAVLVLLLPLLLHVCGMAVHAGRTVSLLPVREFRRSGPVTAGQVLLSDFFLLNQALLALDAIARTLFRLFISRRHLLEWETAAAAERRLGNALHHFYRNMAPSLVCAAGLAAAVALVRPVEIAAAAVFIVPWLLAPLVAYWVSRPLAPRVAPLREAERRELSRIARKTWGFFETFVGPDDHWLPPDNFQEEPRARSRTAPRRPTSAYGCWQRCRHTISATSAGKASSAGSSNRSRRSIGSSAIAGTSTTGTTRFPCCRCSRRTSRPWTAAIWSAACWRSSKGSTKNRSSR